MIEAYRIFFPIGFSFGLYGVALWIFFWLGWLSFFPALVHAQIMVGGFLFFFVVGFLGTAVPRLTATSGMTRTETFAGILFAVGVALATALRHDRCFYSLMTGAITFLVVFMARRRLQSKRNPPAAFEIAFSGIVSGLLGAFLLAIDSFGASSAFGALLGRQLFFHGMMLGLVFGVGGFLIPVLLEQKKDAPEMNATPEIVPTGRLKTILITLIALLLPLSFFADASDHSQWGMSVRALIGVGVALFVWRIQKLPRRRSVLAWSVWSAAWSVVIGLVLQAVFPQFFVHAVHVQLIGGYGVLIFAVATRVIVSHGGYNAQLTRTSKILGATTLLLILAWTTRIFAPAIPRLYVSHLAYAALTWSAGLALWGWGFVPKIVRVNHQGFHAE